MIFAFWIMALLLSFDDVSAITPENVDQMKIIHRLELVDTSAQAMAFNPVDSRQLALAQGNGFGSLWNVITGELQAEWQVSQTPLTAMAYTSDGERLVTMDEDGKVEVWDSISHEQLYTLYIPDQTPVALDTAPNNVMVVGYEDGNVRLWNVNTGENIVTLYGNNSRVWALDVSDDGKRVAFGYSYGTVFIYRLDDIEREHIYIEQTLDAGELNNLAFHPKPPPSEFLDRSVLVTASNFISAQFWDFQYSIDLHSSGTDSSMAYPQELALSHDGSLLAIAGKATTAGGWCESNLCPVEIIATRYNPSNSLSGRAILMSFDIPHEAPLDVAFSPDDRYLVSSFSGGIVLIWGISQ